MHGTQIFVMSGKWQGFRVIPVGQRGKPADRQETDGMDETSQGIKFTVTFKRKIYESRHARPCQCTFCAHVSNEPSPFTIEREDLAEFGQFWPWVFEEIRLNQIYQRTVT